MAAGRGKRLGELTLHTPKPLLKINNLSLIEYRLLALAKAGFTEIVINVSYLGQQIQAYLGDGERYSVKISYSVESEPLEVGGGIKKALPLLGDQPFLLTNSDIYTNFPYQDLKNIELELAHLVLVNNPPHIPGGDFSLAGRLVCEKTNKTYTYSGIAVLHPKLFTGVSKENFFLTEVLKPAIIQKKVTGQYYSGLWQDIGRPHDFFALQQQPSND
ncbi:MAG: mannose-1-phosphate guanylyltransferase, partial [Acinetobacter sp. RIFCSPHIGHO2_12_41_5]